MAWCHLLQIEYSWVFCPSAEWFLMREQRHHISISWFISLSWKYVHGAENFIYTCVLVHVWDWVGICVSLENIHTHYTQTCKLYIHYVCVCVHIHTHPREAYVCLPVYLHFGKHFWNKGESHLKYYVYLHALYILIILIWINCLERKPINGSANRFLWVKNEGEKPMKYERAQRT